jgi:hypothetical protein
VYDGAQFASVGEDAVLNEWVITDRSPASFRVRRTLTLARACVFTTTTTTLPSLALHLAVLQRC